VCSFDQGLDEAAYKESLEKGTPYTEPTAPQNDNPYGNPSLRKFDFASKKVSFYILIIIHIFEYYGINFVATQ
jgi:hypothetical protein